MGLLHISFALAAPLMPLHMVAGTGCVPDTVAAPALALLCVAHPWTCSLALLWPLQEDQERTEMAQRLAHMQPTIAWMSPVTNDATSPAEVAKMAAPPAGGEESTEAAAAAARRQQVRRVGNSSRDTAQNSGGAHAV